MLKLLSSVLLKKRFLILFIFVLFALIVIPQKTNAFNSIDAAFATPLIAIPYAFELIGWGAAKLSGVIFSLIINNLFGLGAITKDSVFLSLWAMVRDWANILIVIALIGIALATILRFRDYEAKKLLVPLIIVALLVNFSIVFVGLMIDISNIVIREFFKNGDAANNMIQRVIDSEKILVQPLINSLFEGGRGNSTRAWEVLARDTLNAAVLLSVFGLVYFTLALTFFYIAVLLVARHALLALFFVFSPLAFVCRVLPIPDIKKIWTSWWEHFMKWCFMGVGAGLTLILAINTLNAVTIAPASYIDPTLGLNSPTFGFLLFRLLLVVMILIVGLKITTKASGVGSVALMGLAGTAGFTVGGFAGAKIGSRLAKGDLKGAWGATREGFQKGFGGVGGAVLTKPVQWVKEKGIGAAESMGIATAGSQALYRQQRFALSDKNKKKLDMANPEQIKALATGEKYATTQEKVYAIQKMQESGDLVGLPPEKQKELAKYAIDSGVSASTFESNPHLAELNQSKVNDKLNDVKQKRTDEILKKHGVNINPTTKKKYTEDEIFDMYKTKINPDTKNNYTKQEALSVHELDIYHQSKEKLALEKEQTINKYKAQVNPNTGKNYSAKEALQVEEESMMEEAKKAVRKSAMQKMDIGQLRKLKTIDEEIIENTNEKKMRKALEEMPQNLVDQIESLKTDADKKTIDALEAMDKAEQAGDKDTAKKHLDIAEKYDKLKTKIEIILSNKL